MVTGHTNPLVAEARARIDDINAGIRGYNEILDAAQKAGDYKFDTVPYFRSAREKLIALRDDLDYLVKYLTDNRDKLEYPPYYEKEIESLDSLLYAMEQSLVVPADTTQVEKEPTEFEGVVTKVQDGDTIIVDGNKAVRLVGLDAAEGGTDAGKFATAYLRSLIEGKNITVKKDPHTEFDQYGRHLGAVFLGDTNVGIKLIADCVVPPMTKFGKNHYLDPDEVKRLHERCVMGWPRAGKCHFSTKPPHARVFIDGVDTHQDTPCDIVVPIGSHKVSYVAYQCSTVTDDFNVPSNIKIDIPERVLTKIPANVGTAIISVEPTDSLSVVSLDGIPVGVAPIIVDLPVDKPTLVSVLSSDGRKTDSQVRPMLGRVVRIILRLSEK